jgi:hypothetical protein
MGIKMYGLIGTNVTIKYRQYASKYEEDMYKLIALFESFGYSIPVKAMDGALIQTNINPEEVYHAISAGKETDNVIRLCKELAELLEKKDSTIVDADKEPVRWLPGSTFPIVIDPTMPDDTLKIGDLVVKIKLPEEQYEQGNP